MKKQIAIAAAVDALQTKKDKLLSTAIAIPREDRERSRRAWAEVQESSELKQINAALHLLKHWQIKKCVGLEELEEHFLGLIKGLENELREDRGGDPDMPLAELEAATAATPTKVREAENQLGLVRLAKECM